MTDSLADILGEKQFETPDIVVIIKNFVKEKFQSTASITIQTNQIIIEVGSSALAGTLRMHLHALQKLCDTEKRLVIRIGR
ncbi:hypothetical protein HY003_04285 [Candidatus Saccharibacteria bacterium]|nr:hypothetical protein [Candidatus Saccharibacteria bacterium]MBI3338487.1 hypothetical protein [Candidatus Saccharibacteria bacterium]